MGLSKPQEEILEKFYYNIPDVIIIYHLAVWNIFRGKSMNSFMTKPLPKPGGGFVIWYNLIPRLKELDIVVDM